MNRAVMGIVRTPWEVDSLIADLQTAGFSASDVTVRRASESPPAVAPDRVSAKSVVIGAVVGTLAVGAALGYFALQVGMGAYVAPGLGSLVAAGPLEALKMGVEVGAVLGALLGGFLTYAVAKRRVRNTARTYSAAEHTVSVHVEDQHQIDVAKQAFAAHRATSVSVGPELQVTAVASSPREAVASTPPTASATPVVMTLQNAHPERTQLPN